MEEPRECLVCGRELRKGQQKYCSQECSLKGRSGICPECGRMKVLLSGGICQACVKRGEREPQPEETGQERITRLRRRMKRRLDEGIERVVARAEAEGRLGNVSVDKTEAGRVVRSGGAIKVRRVG